MFVSCTFTDFQKHVTIYIDCQSVIYVWKTKEGGVCNCTGVADKSFARPGRKQNPTFARQSKKKFRRLSVQPGLRGSNDIRVGRKMATSRLFFQLGRAKDLSAPMYLQCAWLPFMFGAFDVVLFCVILFLVFYVLFCLPCLLLLRCATWWSTAGHTCSANSVNEYGKIKIILVLRCKQPTRCNNFFVY